MNNNIFRIENQVLIDNLCTKFIIHQIRSTRRNLLITKSYFFKFIICNILLWNKKLLYLTKNRKQLPIKSYELFKSCTIEQKGITFDHDFGYSFPTFSSLLKIEGRRKGLWIAKVVIKSHTFLLDLTWFESDFIGNCLIFFFVKYSCFYFASWYYRL